MSNVVKYNLCKGASTALTVCTPIATLCSCSELFVHRSDTAISAAGIFTILLSLLFFKDKIVESFKMPSAFVLSIVMLIFITVIESIILPLKYVCIATIVASGIDELSFKRMYKRTENTCFKDCNVSKTLGFISKVEEVNVG